jgi:hypothetical protein
MCCVRMTGRTARVTFIGLKARCQLSPHLLQRQLFKKARIKLRGIVEQHIDAAKLVHGSLDGEFRVVGFGNIQLHDKQVADLPRAWATLSVLRPLADYLMACRQSSPSDINPHSAPGAGYQPNIAHLSVLLISLPRRASSVCGYPSQYAFPRCAPS